MEEKEKKTISDNFENPIPSTIKGGQYFRPLNKALVLPEPTAAIESTRFVIDEDVTDFINSPMLRPIIKEISDKTIAIPVEVYIPYDDRVENIKKIKDVNLDHENLNLEVD